MGTFNVFKLAKACQLLFSMQVIVFKILIILLKLLHITCIVSLICLFNLTGLVDLHSGCQYLLWFFLVVAVIFINVNLCRVLGYLIVCFVVYI